MKKIVLFFIVVFLSISISGCKKNKNNFKSVEEIKQNISTFDIVANFNGIRFELIKTSKGYYLADSDKNIYVMSFYNTVIDKLNIKNKTYKVGILNYVLNTTEKHFKYDFICILRPFLNDKIIEFVKKNNKELFVYGNYNNNFKYDFPYYIVD